MTFKLTSPPVSSSMNGAPVECIAPEDFLNAMAMRRYSPGPLPRLITVRPARRTRRGRKPVGGPSGASRRQPSNSRRPSRRRHLPARYRRSAGDDATGRRAGVTASPAARPSSPSSSHCADGRLFRRRVRGPEPIRSAATESQVAPSRRRPVARAGGRG